MTNIIQMPRPAKPAGASRVKAVLRVARGEGYVGDILIDKRGRVWRHADTIPADVVLKALVAHRRGGDGCGRVVGLRDGKVYSWVVVGATAEAA